ncbi:hypothetical protein ACHAW5_000376 [Stephanodiscus triporus]|uniref:pantothenate kinase n=1 Tax=Stephanodiscus triporus TaxID=2934178 RepID=A0ABD3N4B4_9STRA
MPSRQKAELTSFIAGVLSASVVWSLGWAARRILFPHKSLPKLDYGDDEASDEESSSDNRLDAVNVPLHKRRLARWPWDELRKSVIYASASLLNFNLGHESDVSVTAAKNKTGPCIGEIFGLDVGGTLTKFVYFEQGIEEHKRHSVNEGLHRREHYSIAASALEVLQARRSSSALHQTDSNADLQGLWGLRQESVPDRLDEFASSCNLNRTSFSPGNQSNQPVESSRMPMKRTRSMVTLTKSMEVEHAEALDNFYSFARRLDTYETALKDKHLSYYSRFLNGTFHFFRFETRRMHHAMNLIRYNDFHLSIKEIGATGGGAHKYANDWERELGIMLTKQDEMDSLVAGMQFVMTDIVGECFTFKPSDWTPQPSSDQDQVTAGSIAESTQQLRVGEISSPESASIPGSTNESIPKRQTSEPKESLPQNDTPTSEASRPRTDQWWTSKKVKRDNVILSELYPYLLVSIGTGVSILRVDGPRKHERISGSTIGGGTYWGLCRLLTGSDSFKDILDLASKGDSSKVDMMVGDIYGKESKALEKIGLSSDIVASSFGKLVANQNPSRGIKEGDLARALLLMVTNNIGQVAHLNAKLHKTRKIYFIGTFLQQNVISQQRLAYSIDYWSQGTMEAQFLEHEVNCFVALVA